MGIISPTRLNQHQHNCICQFKCAVSTSYHFTVNVCLCVCVGVLDLENGHCSCVHSRFYFPPLTRLPLYVTRCDKSHGTFSFGSRWRERWINLTAARVLWERWRWPGQVMDWRKVRDKGRDRGRQIWGEKTERWLNKRKIQGRPKIAPSWHQSDHPVWWSHTSSDLVLFKRHLNE